MIQLSSLFLFFLSFSICAQTTSFVPIGTVLPKKGYELKIEGKSWASDHGYDLDGEEVKFDREEAFHVYDVEFTGKYGATKDLEFRGILNYRQDESKQLASDGDYVDATNSGLQAVGIGAQFAFPKVDKRWQYTLDAFYKYIPYTNTDYKLSDYGTLTSDDLGDKKLVLGDDGNDYGAGFSVTYESKSKNSFASKLMYRRPGSSLSAELDYQFELAAAFRIISVMAGVQGVYSMNELEEDDDAPDPDDRAPYLGTTNLYYSFNRQFYQPYAGFNVALGKGWRVEARAGLVSSGRSTDSGSFISIAFARRQDQNQFTAVDKKFKEYSIEANVSKVSEKKSYVIIDKGLSSGIQQGTRFDFFYNDFVGGNVLLARGIVTKVNADQSVVKITSRFSSQHEIKEGTIVRSFLD